MTFKNAFAAIVFSFLPLTAAHAALIQVSVDPECRVDLIGVIVKGDAEAFEKLAEHLIVNNGESTIGPVAVSFRSGSHVRRPCVRRPRGFSNLRLNADGVDCRSR